MKYEQGLNSNRFMFDHIRDHLYLGDNDIG